MSQEVEKLRKHIEELEAKDESSEERIQVQHILIAFEDTLGSKFLERSRDQAEQLAAEVYEQLGDDADFDWLLKKHTDDSPPGIYTMLSEGTPNHRELVFLRGEMVPAFGNVGWRLEGGEIGVAPHDPTTSPFGWHIVKRLE